jgi:hypothetical protein
VRLAALERCREQVHQRTEKFALAGVECALFAGMDDKRSVWTLRTGKDDTQAADHAQLAHLERVLGGLVESQVLDHHGLRQIERLRAAGRVALERKLALGAFGKGHEPIQTTVRPAVRRDDAQRLAVGLPREQGAEVDLQPFGSQRHSTVDQPRWLRFAQGIQAELGEPQVVLRRDVPLARGGVWFLVGRGHKGSLAPCRRRRAGQPPAGPRKQSTPSANADLCRPSGRAGWGLCRALRDEPVVRLT